jgi:MurNAc alpha-1-phosphate uridylyltransferase
MPLLPEGPALIVSGDIWSAFDYATLRSRAEAMARNAAAPRVHLVMVPNPSYHPDGDFALTDGRVASDGAPRQTYANIGLYDTALFRELPRRTSLQLLPYLQRWIADHLVSGEHYDGPWTNVGTPDDLAKLDGDLRKRQPTRSA